MLAPGIAVPSSKRRQSSRLLRKNSKKYGDDNVARLAKEMAKEITDIVRNGGETIEEKEARLFPRPTTPNYDFEGGTCIICIGSTGK